MNIRFLLLVLVFPALLFSQEDKQKSTTDTISKKNRWGIEAGFSSLTLKKENYVYGKYDPFYRSAFYFRKRLIPNIGFFLLTKNNNIHSLSFGYRNYGGSEPNRGNIFYMNVKTTDVIINYQYHYSLNKKVVSQKKPSLTPFIGLGAYYNMKNYFLSDSSPGIDYYYNLKIESSSNLFLFQLSPSLKYMSEKITVSFGLNLNLLGIVFGKYNYNKDDFFDTSNEYFNTNIDEQYTEIVLPNNIIKDWFFYNDISLKVGFIF